MKKLHCILLLLGSAAMACMGENPVRPDFGDGRYFEPQLSGARWARCCAKPPQIRTSCPEKVKTREQALELLVTAHGDCLDNAVLAVQSHAPDDLAAAYLVRAERKRDPLDLLRAWQAANGFNRALVLERLGLREEAIAAWDDVVGARSDWSEEARDRRDRKRPAAAEQWSRERLERALKQRDRATVRSLAHGFPVDATRFFETSNLHDLAAARLLADALVERGEQYPKAVVEALEHPKNRIALERGLQEFRAENYERAATLLEQAGNPLSLGARYRVARIARAPRDLSLLDPLAGVTPRGYRTLFLSVHLSRAGALETRDQYLEAQAAYENALGVADHDPLGKLAILNRRSANYTTIGSPEMGFRASLGAISLLPRVVNLNESHQAYGSAAKAVRALGYDDIALLYQNAAVRRTLRAVAGEESDADVHAAVALRARAELHAARGDITAAAADVEEASKFAEASNHWSLPLLRMRVREVRGDVRLPNDPAGAVGAYREAIELAEAQDSTYRAVLHFKRAEARRRAGDPRAEEDVTSAFAILHNEAKRLIDQRRLSAYEELWTPYFSRFQAMQHAAIERTIAAGKIDEAFVLGEQARAFEPMHVLMQLQSVPDFRPIRTVDDLQYHLSLLRPDTAILQFVVLPTQTYVWVLTHGRIRFVQLPVGEAQIEQWVERLQAPVRDKQRGPFIGVMRAVYTDLFRTALAETANATNLVIVADGPMHGLPFAALHGMNEEGFLIERRNIATAGSTSLHLYARLRDAQFSRERSPSVVLVGNPALHPRSGLKPLGHALHEVEELRRHHYPGAEVLTGNEATIPRFLEAARKATIVHFAGHAVPNPQTPWKSRLFLAPQNGDGGELTAEKLMRELSALERTRLVVLGACSTAGGQPVGPEGLAPLVRPLIAANVPAVVGTLWDVNDATSKNLLVSLHCHYRHGDDVAVALSAAQRERLRNNENPMTWAAFQVVGYAGSPCLPRVTMEETHNDGLCTEDCLHRPDGLHPQ